MRVLKRPGILHLIFTSGCCCCSAFTMCLIAHLALLTANLITPFLQRTSYRVDRLLRRRDILVKPIALIENTHFETAWGTYSFWVCRLLPIHQVHITTATNDLLTSLRVDQQDLAAYDMTPWSGALHVLSVPLESMCIQSFIFLLCALKYSTRFVAGMNYSTSYGAAEGRQQGCGMYGLYILVSLQTLLPHNKFIQ